MPYDQQLAQRIRTIWSRKRGTTEVKMFGGVAFSLHGHICLGIWGQALIVRVGPQAYEAARTLPWVGEFDITGRPLRGWVLVEPQGIETDEELADWIKRGWVFVKSLPPKPAPKPASRPKRIIR